MSHRFTRPFDLKLTLYAAGVGLGRNFDLKYVHQAKAFYTITAPNVSQTCIKLRAHPELQSARCMAKKYASDSFPQCVSCVRRQAGDTCRFQNLRYFLREGDRIQAYGFLGSSVLQEDVSMFSIPLEWNVELNKTHVEQTMVR